jgi:hypothetical protein
MMNRFSTDIVKGNICRERMSGLARKNGQKGQFLECRSGGRQFEDFLKDIFSSLPFPAGTANISKNVIKNDDFYGAYRGEFLW